MKFYLTKTWMPRRVLGFPWISEAQSKPHQLTFVFRNNVKRISNDENTVLEPFQLTARCCSRLKIWLHFSFSLLQRHKIMMMRHVIKKGNGSPNMSFDEVE